MTDQRDIIIRGNCFKLLAACFYEPDKDLLLEEQVCENLSKLLDTWASGAAKAAGEMTLSLKTCSQDQLSIDHAALFVGPFELIAAPYGSVYKEQNRQVMGKSTIDVLRFYQDAGLAVEIKEPPDHIAIELEFMYYLCTKEADSLANGHQEEAEKFRSLQRQFFQTSLEWVPRFCETIKLGTSNPFYSGLADCLGRFMVTCERFYVKTAEINA
jgi:TorA maturation chaperone TorD